MADGLTRFAVFYVCIRVILIVNYARAYLVIEQVRPLLMRFMIGFSIGCGFWLCAAYTSSSMAFRTLFIVLGLLADYGTPFALLPMMVRVHPQHMTERFFCITQVVNLVDPFTRSL